MANEEHLRILKQGIRVWNRWREANIEVQPNLRGASLEGVDFQEVDFSDTNLGKVNLHKSNLNRANLRLADLGGTYLDGASLREAILTAAFLGGASLNKVDLSRTNLGGANLSGAKLSGASLHEAYLIYADLSSTDLSEADLSKAKLSRANLDKANFREAIVGYTIFGDVDLREVKGLESIKSLGPSTIGIDTLYRSVGEISPVFLEKVGVDPDIIKYLDTIKTPECPYTLQMLNTWIQDGQELLIGVNKRLRHYQNQEAKYGSLQVPYSIVAEINDAKTRFEEIQSQIKEWQRLKSVYY